jgi:hypothetical protein
MACRWQGQTAKEEQGMTTYKDKVEADKEFVDWCDRIGFTLTPLQKIILAKLPFDGGKKMAEPFTILKGKRE